MQFQFAERSEYTFSSTEIYERANSGLTFRDTILELIKKPLKMRYTEMLLFS